MKNIGNKSSSSEHEISSLVKDASFSKVTLRRKDSKSSSLMKVDEVNDGHSSTDEEDYIFKAKKSFTKNSLSPKNHNTSGKCFINQLEIKSSPKKGKKQFDDSKNHEDGVIEEVNQNNSLLIIKPLRDSNIDDGNDCENINQDIHIPTLINKCNSLKKHKKKYKKLYNFEVCDTFIESLPVKSPKTKNDRNLYTSESDIDAASLQKKSKLKRKVNNQESFNENIEILDNNEDFRSKEETCAEEYYVLNKKKKKKESISKICKDEANLALEYTSLNEFGPGLNVSNDNPQTTLNSQSDEPIIYDKDSPLTKKKSKKRTNKLKSYEDEIPVINSSKVPGHCIKNSNIKTLNTSDSVNADKLKNLDDNPNDDAYSIAAKSPKKPKLSKKCNDSEEIGQIIYVNSPNTFLTNEGIQSLDNINKKKKKKGIKLNKCNNLETNNNGSSELPITRTKDLTNLNDTFSNKHKKKIKSSESKIKKGVQLHHSDLKRHEEDLLESDSPVFKSEERLKSPSKNKGSEVIDQKTSKHNIKKLKEISNGDLNELDRIRAHLLEIAKQSFIPKKNRVSKIESTEMPKHTARSSSVEVTSFQKNTLKTNNLFKPEKKVKKKVKVKDTSKQHELENIKQKLLSKALKM